MRFSSIIFGFIWKKSLITCTVGLALGFRNSLLDACEINTDHADAGFQPAAPSRFRSLTLTNCCRSRFVVANYVSESPSNAKAAAGAARRQARATRCCDRRARAEGSSHEQDRRACEASVCVVCVLFLMPSKAIAKTQHTQKRELFPSRSKNCLQELFSPLDMDCMPAGKLDNPYIFHQTLNR